MGSLGPLMNFIFKGRQSSRPGFTILELLIVISLTALMLTMISSIFFRPRPQAARDELVNNFSALIMQGYINALESNVLHRIVFDFDKKEIRLEKMVEKKDIKGDSVFEKVDAAYGASEIAWPDNLEIKNVYINRYDELTKQAGAKTRRIWFYISPDGMAQELIVNARDAHDIDNEGNSAQMSVVLNPFSMQLEQYAVFQQP